MSSDTVIIQRQAQDVRGAAEIVTDLKADTPHWDQVRGELFAPDEAKLAALVRELATIVDYQQGQIRNLKGRLTRVEKAEAVEAGKE